MLRQLKCPITNETILVIGNDGIKKRSGYREIWLSLADNSKMRVAISKKALDNLKENQVASLFDKIQKQREETIKKKKLSKKIETKQLSRITSNKFVSFGNKKINFIIKKNDK